MRKGTVIFNGGEGDKNTYLLGLNEDNLVVVYRNFRGVEGDCGLISSGWRYEVVEGNRTLTIDGGTNWVVFPTKEAWKELSEFITNEIV